MFISCKCIKESAFLLVDTRVTRAAIGYFEIRKVIGSSELSVAIGQKFPMTAVVI